MSTPVLNLRIATTNVVQYSIFLSFLFLLGCLDLDDSGSDNSELLKNAFSDTKIEGQATNSVIEKGIVRSYQIVHSEEGSTTSTVPFGLPIRTDESGHFSFQLPSDVQPTSILLKITADEATKMTCDVVSGCTINNSDVKIAFGSTFLLDDQFEITAILPELDHGFTNTISVNPLTHLAATLAQSQEIGPTFENIESSYRYIESLFGLQTEALQLITPDLTKLDDQAEISKVAMKVSILSASFLALLNSPDWSSVSGIIHHATSRVSTTGSITAANMGALPEVALDDLFYLAGDIAQSLMTQTNDSAKQNTLNKIFAEVNEAYELAAIIPEVINSVEIEKHPASITVTEGLTSSFQVNVFGDDISYQWRFNNTPIIGANEAAYIINNTSIKNTGTYDVIVSNIVGSQVSFSALLTVLVIEKTVPTQPDNSNEQATDNSTEQATDNGTEQPQNTPPAAQDDTIEIFEDTPTIIYVLNNDSDLENDPLTITHAVVTHGPGNVSIQSIDTDDGQPFNALLFTPEQDSNSSSVISYTVIGGYNNQSSALVNVQIVPINDAPKSSPDTAEMDENTRLTLNVLANDYDPDHDTLTLSSASSASGSVVVNPDNTITFQPIDGFNGTAEINYITLDGHGGITAGIATVTVNNVNDSPIAINDTAETIEDTAITINVLSNDSDGDFDELKVSSASASKGQVSINADNTLTYTPTENLNGSAIINYTISDDKGGSSSAEVNLSILAVNDSPVVSNDTAQTDEDTPVIINILSNDNDVDNDLLTVTDAIATSAGAIVSINEDNTLTVIPFSDFNGEVSLSYTVNDNHGATAKASVIVIVNAINDLPILINHQAFTEQSVEVKIDALIGAYDLDGDTLNIIAATALNGAVTLDGSQSITYQPAPDFSGEDIISYSVSDGKGGITNAVIMVFVSAIQELYSIELNWERPIKRDDGTPLFSSDIKGYSIAYGINSNQLDSFIFVSGAQSTHHIINNLNLGTYYFAIATVTNDDIQGAYSEEIAVSSSNLPTTDNVKNTPPIAQDDAIDIFEDTATNIYVLINDTDIDNDHLTITHAAVANGPGKVSIQSIVTDTAQSSNVLLFTPEQDSNISSVISYTVIDGHNNQSSALVNVQILPINDAPKSFPDTAEMDENTRLTLNVLANDYDPDHDTLTLSSASSAFGVVVVNPDNTITFQPTDGFNGTAEINYITLDGHGGITAGIATITVNNVNDSPIATNDTSETTEDSAIVINVLSNDSDRDFDELTVTYASSSKGQVSINTDNTLTYAPTENFNGSAIINYTISDEKGGFSSAEVKVSVLAVNDSPNASNDTVQTNEDTPVIINILSNDNDVDNDILTVTDVHTITPGGMVSINRDNTLTFVPVSNFNGEVSLSYTVNDNHGSIVDAFVTVIINAINDLPVLVDHQTTTEQEVEVKIDALVGAYDLDGDSLNITASTALNGTVTFDDSQTVTYQPASNFSGEDIISYSVSDGKGGVTIAMITVFVNAVQTLSSIELNWELPTKRDDGTPLHSSDIKGYSIAYGINSNQLDSSIFVSDAQSTRHTINDLNLGTYYFAIATVTNDDIQGAYSEKIMIPIIQHSTDE